MTSQELIALDSQCVMQTYGRFPLVVDHGQGATVYSPEGRAYVDFASGIGVNSVGYGNAAWQKAITDQIGKLGHISNLYYSEPYIRVAQQLTQRSGMKRVFFANGGGEANEGAIKLARKYSFDKYGMGRSTILTLYNSFHGRTVTTLAATGQEVFHNYFFPFTEGFRYAKANDIEDVKAQAGGDVCAVMMELVQGEGGVLPLDADFVLQVRDLCAENDWLLIIDEVQTGVGRTGSLFCFQQFGLEPDVVTFAKGIAGGLPLAGVMAGAKTESVLGPGTHATTFGGNPVCCAAALAVLDILDDAMMQEIRAKGQYIREKVAAMGSPVVTGVRGMGLMLGIGLKAGVSHKELASKCLEAGLLLLTAGSDTLRLLPPLTISYQEIDQGLEILRKILCEGKQ